VILSQHLCDFAFVVCCVADTLMLSASLIRHRLDNIFLMDLTNSIRESSSQTLLLQQHRRNPTQPIPAVFLRRRASLLV
jgi:hypothetical protein